MVGFYSFGIGAVLLVVGYLSYRLGTLMEYRRLNGVVSAALEELRKHTTSYLHRGDSTSKAEVVPHKHEIH